MGPPYHFSLWYLKITWFSVFSYSVSALIIASWTHTHLAGHRTITTYKRSTDSEHGEQLEDDLFVSENLTPTRQKIAYALRQAKKNFPSIVSGTNTMNGVHCVWIKPTGRSTGGSSTRHKIVSHATLKRLYNDTLGSPLEDVVDDFSD